MPDDCRLYVNEERTVMVRIWDTSLAYSIVEMEVSRRENPSDVWGPPIVVTEEKFDDYR